jgi:hypothetical protein
MSGERSEKEMRGNVPVQREHVPNDRYRPAARNPGARAGADCGVALRRQADDAISFDSDTNRNPRVRSSFRIVGRASAVFRPRPLM